MFYETKPYPYKFLFRTALKLFWRTLPKSAVFAVLSCVATLATIILPLTVYPWNKTTPIYILIALINFFAWLAMFDGNHKILLQQRPTFSEIITHTAKRFLWALSVLIFCFLILYYAGKWGEAIARNFLLAVGIDNRMAHMAVALFGVPIIYASTLLLYAPILVITEDQTPWRAVHLSCNYVYRKWFVGFLPCGLIYVSFSIYYGVFYIFAKKHWSLYAVIPADLLIAALALPFIVTLTLFILNDLKLRRALYEEKLTSRFRKRR